MMQLINTASTAVTAGGTLPANLDFNSNETVLDFNSNTNEILFKQPGIYKVTANVVFEATAAGTNTISAYSSTNGAAVPGLTSTVETADATQTATYSLEKDVRIAPSALGSYARMNLLSNVAGTMLNLVVSVEKLR